MRDYAIGPYNTADAYRHSLKNKRSVADPGAAAYSDWPYVGGIGNAVGNPFVERRRVAVVIGYSAVRGDQDVIFNHDFPVAGDRYMAAEETEKVPLMRTSSPR
jgi:hypothetical protein